MQQISRDSIDEITEAVTIARHLGKSTLRDVLQSLVVVETSPPPELTADEAAIWNALKIRGGQLGVPTYGSIGDYGCLMDEIVYGYWHRTLFSRYLAENCLLMYPMSGGPVPVSLEECDRLAAEAGESDGWALAARLAEDMLPQIFTSGSPVTRSAYPREKRGVFSKCLSMVSPELFRTSEALFWFGNLWHEQGKLLSRISIYKRPEYPACTQLGADQSMVRFVLDNTLGAWWCARQVPSDFLKASPDIGEIRNAASLEGVGWEKLSMTRGGDGSFTPVAGTFDGWPKDMGELKILDPCCGSGHFLVEAFRMLVPMRMKLEGLTAENAVDSVLRDNIHGLELDRRSAEIAKFALTLSAWTYPGAGGYRVLPRLNVACHAVSADVEVKDWLSLAGGNERLAGVIDRLRTKFCDVQVLGSLAEPESGPQTESLTLQDMEYALECLDKKLSDTPDELPGSVLSARETLLAASLLSRRYQLVLADVPSYPFSRQEGVLRDFCERNYPLAFHDLSTVFIERCLKLLSTPGVAGFVSPAFWLLQDIYVPFREAFIDDGMNRFLFGPQSKNFCAEHGRPVRSSLLSIGHGMSSGDNAGRAVATDRLPDVSLPGMPGSPSIPEHAKPCVIDSPDAWIRAEDCRLGGLAASDKGMTTGDDARFRRFFWEMPTFDPGWRFCHSSIGSTVHFGGRSSVISWKDRHLWNVSGCPKHTTSDALGVVLTRSEKPGPEPGAVRDSEMCQAPRTAGTGTGDVAGREKGKPSKIMWMEKTLRLDDFKTDRKNSGSLGVAVSLSGKPHATLYAGDYYLSDICVISPRDFRNLSPIWSFFSSQDFEREIAGEGNVSKTSKTLKVSKVSKVSKATLENVQLDIDAWTSKTGEEYPWGLPAPYSDDPTQWIFHGHPCGSAVWDPSRMRVAPGPRRMDRTVLQVAVCRVLGYRWPAEIHAGMPLSGEQRRLVKLCGSLPRSVSGEGDGILCIPRMGDEEDGQSRVLEMLSASYGKSWSDDVLKTLLDDAGFSGKDLGDWLRDGFFAQHCSLFRDRPFIWHIWDGHRLGFSAFINSHRLSHGLLKSLVNDRLDRWIRNLKSGSDPNAPIAREMIVAASALSARLRAILKGDAPYDIFVRWKSLKGQPKGYRPDLDDGVRLNIRPFMTGPDIKIKGAGILRARPHIDWRKDRGTDDTAPDVSKTLKSKPWLEIFKGQRINDYHIPFSDKRESGS
ncbi:MAG: hypothetical protein LBT40_09080 [Deltaproteobacteria bacterium]|jgi:hypothetical protein|nr:hypothetical protein [Deltaproteobacteria bacterium]